MTQEMLIDAVAFAIYSNFIRHDPRAAERWGKMSGVAQQRWKDDAIAALAVVERAFGKLPTYAVST